MIICAAGAGSISSSTVQLQCTVTFYPAFGRRFEGHCETLLHFLTKSYLIQRFGSITGTTGTGGITGSGTTFSSGTVGMTGSGGNGHSYLQNTGVISIISYKVAFLPLIHTWKSRRELLW